MRLVFDDIALFGKITEHGFRLVAYRSKLRRETNELMLKMWCDLVDMTENTLAELDTELKAS